MPIRIKPPVRQPKLTDAEVRRRAFKAAARIYGQTNQHINIGTKKK
jgi:hypothetical protein